jgi:hypothetical protein
MVFRVRLARAVAQACGRQGSTKEAQKERKHKSRRGAGAGAGAGCRFAGCDVVRVQALGLLQVT